MKLNFKFANVLYVYNPQSVQLNYSLSKLHFDEEIAGKVIINLARLTSAKCVFIIINYCTK